MTNDNIRKSMIELEMKNLMTSIFIIGRVMDLKGIDSPSPKSIIDKYSGEAGDSMRGLCDTSENNANKYFESINIDKGEADIER